MIVSTIDKDSHSRRDKSPMLRFRRVLISYILCGIFAGMLKPFAVLALTHPLYATNVIRQGTVWQNVAGAEGFNPSCTDACPCDANQVARNSAAGNTDTLKAIAFTTYAHSPAEVISAVRFDVHGRYDTENDGGNFRARIVIRNSAGQIVANQVVNPPNSFQNNQNCKWRFPDASRDITSLVNWNADPGFVNRTELHVWRNGNPAPMFVNAFKLSVETVPSPAVCSVDVGDIDFGEVLVGATADRNVVITNLGGQALTGTPSAACYGLSVVAGGVPYSLGYLQSHTFTVRFQPPTGGQYSCQASTGCGISVLLAGLGIGPLCSVSPPQFDYGPVGVGCGSREETFMITNAGGGVLPIDVQFASPGAGFEFVYGSGLHNVLSGQTHNVRVRFQPDALGPSTCVVSTGCAQAVSFQATGVPCGACCGEWGVSTTSQIECLEMGGQYQGDGSPESTCPVCAVSETFLDFGDVGIGKSSVRSLMIRNVGSGVLQGQLESVQSPFSILGEGAQPFALSGGDSLRAVICFLPQNDWGYSGSVDVVCEDAEDRWVDLQGSGSDTGACCAPIGCWVSTRDECSGIGDYLGDGSLCLECDGLFLMNRVLDFGAVWEGLSSDLMLNLKNTNSYTVSASVSSDCPAFEVLVPNPTIGPDQVLGVPVRFHAPLLAAGATGKVGVGFGGLAALTLGRSMPLGLPAFDVMTEGVAAIWRAQAEGAAATVANDVSTVQVGTQSLRFDTTGGFDTWLWYPFNRNANWNLSSAAGLRFWALSQNASPVGFQNSSPWIRLGSANGYFELHATREVLNDSRDFANKNWLLVEVPFTGNSDWTRTVVGSPSLLDIDYIEIHIDTWDFGFTLWLDDLSFTNGSAVTGTPVVVSPPTRLDLRLSGANPFRESVAFFADLPHDSDLNIIVYDVTGRRVRTIFNQRAPAGRHLLGWDGRDTEGRPASSGVYFVRMVTRESAFQRKVVRIAP